MVITHSYSVYTTSHDFSYLCTRFSKAINRQKKKNMRLSEQRSSMLHGILLIALFACAAFYIGGMDWVKTLSFSPMVVGIIIGMLYANSLRNNLPDTWVPGIKFCSKRILRNYLNPDESGKQSPSSGYSVHWMRYALHLIPKAPRDNGNTAEAL